MSYQTKILREPFQEAYYKTGNYRDYLNRKFALLAQEVVAPIDVKVDAPILDYGCGCGGFANALADLGFRNIQGTDISDWAISEAKRRYPHLHWAVHNPHTLTQKWSLITMLDVLEHVPDTHVNALLLQCAKVTTYLAFRIPVCAVEGERFVLPVSNNDPTHICCHTKEWWRSQLTAANFTPHHTYAGKAIYDSPGVFAAIYRRTTSTQ